MARREVTVETDVDGRGLGGFQIHVRGKVVSIVIHFGVVILQLEIAGHTHLVVVAQRHIVVRAGQTASDADVGAAVVAPILEDLLHPVHCGIEILVVHSGVVVLRQTVGLLRSLDVLGRVERRRTRIGVGVSLVGDGHISIGVGHLGHVGHAREALVIVERDRRLAHLTGLGLDDDNAVGASHAVNRGSRSVLQHGERLDILGVDVVEAALHAVHENKRLRVLARKGRDTADPDIRIVVTRLAAALNRNDARDTARDGRRQVTRRDLDILGAQSRLCSHNRHLTLAAVTHHHEFVERRHVLDEHHIDHVLRAHAYLLRLEAEERKLEDRIGVLQFERVLTVRIGDDGIVGTHLHNGSAGHKLALLVRDTARYGRILSVGGMNAYEQSKQ